MAYGVSTYPPIQRKPRDTFQDICEAIDPIFKGWQVMARERPVPSRTFYDCQELIATKGVDFYTRSFTIPRSCDAMQRATIIKQEIVKLGSDIKSHYQEPPLTLSNFLQSLV